MIHDENDPQKSILGPYTGVEKVLPYKRFQSQDGGDEL